MSKKHRSRRSPRSPHNSKQSRRGFRWDPFLWFVSLASVGSSWCLGGVNDAVYFVAAIIGFLALVVIAIRNWNIPGHSGLWSSLLPWCLLLPFVLGTVQIIPLPVSVVKTISPRSVAVNEFLRNGYSIDDDESKSSYSSAKRVRCLSLVPSATRFEMARYWVVYCFALIGMFGLSSRQRRVSLLKIVVFNGSAIALFALVQRLSWNGKILWEIDVPWDFVLGPFVNKNNGAGYLLMVLGALMSLLSSGDSESSSVVRSNRWRLNLRLGTYRLLHDNQLATRYASFIILWLAILISMSRGGFAAAVAASVVTVFTVFRRRMPGMLLMLGITMVLALSVIVWSNQAGEVRDRIASIAESDEYRETRFLHWGDDLHLANDYLPVGIGLGAYQFANRSYQTFKLNAWHRYSENQFLESLIVGGIPGFVLLILFLSLAWKATLQLRRHGNKQSLQIAALGIFVLTSQMVAAFFDFGLYNAANGILMAMLIGIVLGASAQIATPNRSWAKLSYRAWLVVSVAVGLLALIELGLRTNLERAMHWSSTKVHVVNAGPDTSPVDIARETGVLTEAIRKYPDQPFAHLRLANLHILRFRLDLLEELKNLNVDFVSDDTLWNYTDPFVVSSKLRQQSPQEVATIVEERLKPAWFALHRARQSHGMIPQVHYLMSLLEPIVSPQDTDPTGHIDRLVHLAPQDTESLFNAGIVMVQADQRSRGLELVRKATSLEKILPAHVATFARHYLTPTEFVNLVCPSDPVFLLDVIQRRFPDTDTDSVWQSALASRAQELLQVEKDVADPASHDYRIGLARFYQGESREACDAFKAAIEQQPGIGQWRLAYAKSLAASGKFSDALREARLSLRLLPDSWRAKRLVRSLESEKQKQFRTPAIP